MNKNLVIALGGGLLIAVLVALLVQLSLGGKEEVKKVEVEKRVEILVASKTLSVGDELSSENMSWQKWPEGTVFPGAIKREGAQSATDALSGRVGRGVAAGEPLVKSALLDNVKGNLVAARLSAGQRAVAINVSASSMAGGFIGPDDFVDVILTYKESIRTDDEDPQVQQMIERNLDKMATETILENVKVLAVDQMAKRAADGKIKVGRTVTLAVNSKDAERLTLAEQLGDLTLALRGVGDEDPIAKDWPTVSDARLTSIDDELFTEYEKMQNDTGIRPNIVRIYNGEAVSAVSVK